MQALLELDSIPAGMELFPAADDDQWTLIRRVIDDCDYYIVIIGGRYGSIGPEDKSFTQLEYEYAVSQKKPVIAFLHKDPGKLQARDTEKDADKQKKLEEFRSLAEQKMVKYWTSPADLGSVVSRSIIKLIRNNPAIGWVKADLIPSQDATEEILQLRKQVDSLERELESSRTTAPKETQHLSQGDDTFELHYNFSTYLVHRYRADQSYKSSFDVSWNQIFARISPLMIDEANDRQLVNELSAMVENINTESLKKNKDLEGYNFTDFAVNLEDFNTMKVQLLALKLIVKSVKGRSVKDTQNYWTLTPYGEAVMTQLRAIRRKGHEMAPPSPSIKGIETGAS